VRYRNKIPETDTLYLAFVPFRNGVAFKHSRLLSLDAYIGDNGLAGLRRGDQGGELAKYKQYQEMVKVMLFQVVFKVNNFCRIKLEIIGEIK
jgi:hypothetical protein